MGHRFILFLSLLALAASAASAQESDTSLPARKIVHQVAPVYPDLAKRIGISGIVRLRATIAPNGSVKLIEPVGGNPVLIKAAQEAVENWKYAPAPHETLQLIELRFNAPH
jgi:TonB family protein